MFPPKIAVAFHVFACIQSAFALFVYHHYVEHFRKRTFGGHWKYLTYINLHLQFLCFAICLLHDFFKQLQMHAQARKVYQVKGYVYSTLGLPVCVIVFVTFWTLYITDRELVHPSYLDDFLPPWTNHVWHTTILIMLVEGVCDYHLYPPRPVGLLICTAFGLLYFLWLEIIYSQSGIIVYPFLRDLTGFPYVVFFICETGFVCLIYLLGEYCNIQMRPHGRATPKPMRKVDHRKRR